MRIYISSPGQFYEGFNSKLRGEGRWLMHMAGVLARSGHEVAVFSNDPVRPYQDQGVTFSSIFNFQGHDLNCDVLVAMDSFSDLPGTHKTNITPLLDNFNPQRRVWAGFFPCGDDDVYNYIPTIHPWNYQQCRDGKATWLPIITHVELQAPGFERKRFHWYSKNAHEEPKYIAGVMMALHELASKQEVVGSFVDGVQIGSQKYQKEYPQNKEDLTKILFKEILVKGSESFSHWAPYDYVQSLMSQSKMLVGVHHPVAAPSMAEIVSYGGFPLQFKNQKDCPPYDQVDIPFIPEDASDEQVREFILEVWNNEELFTSTVLTCQEAIRGHGLDEAAVRINKFFEEL